jgi:hypothetical protein
MLKLFLLFIASSVIVWSMSITTIFTAVFDTINYNSDYLNEMLPVIMDLLNLQTGVPVFGFHITDLITLRGLIEGAEGLFELGYAHVNGVLVYAIKVDNLIYSVDPQTFHDLIYILNEILSPTAFRWSMAVS